MVAIVGTAHVETAALGCLAERPSGITLGSILAASSSEPNFAARESFYYTGSRKLQIQGAIQERFRKKKQCDFQFAGPDTRRYLCSSTESSSGVSEGSADSTYSTFAGRFSRSLHGLRSPAG
jgi:hypothetical protein